MNQVWFVVIQIPGEESLEKSRWLKWMKWKRNAGILWKKNYQRLSDLTKSVHSLTYPSMVLLIYPCINKCPLCLRYCGRYFGESNEQGMVLHYKEADRDKK